MFSIFSGWKSMVTEKKMLAKYLEECSKEEKQISRNKSPPI
jgi:hypothetical protein